jgi:protein phosphatase
MQQQRETALYSTISKSEDDNLNMAELPYKVLSVGLSDMGLVRQNNEDVWAEQPSIGLFVLADGMGGHQAGEVAARETATSLCRVLKKKITPQKKYSFTDLQDLLKRAIIHVNGLVYKMGRSQYELRGMGTTLCCLLFHADGLVFAHVGDSRIYRMREGKFEQLTKDHSLLRDLVEQGQLNDNQATDFLYKNIITKAIGTEPKVEPSVKCTSIHKDDLYLMCSDGLSDLLSAKEISDIINQAPSQKQAVQMLIDGANEKGGRDNITVVITKIKGLDDSEDLSR